MIYFFAYGKYLFYENIINLLWYIEFVDASYIEWFELIFNAIWDNWLWTPNIINSDNCRSEVWWSLYSIDERKFEFLRDVEKWYDEWVKELDVLITTRWDLEFYWNTLLSVNYNNELSPDILLAKRMLRFYNEIWVDNLYVSNYKKKIIENNKNFVNT